MRRAIYDSRVFDFLGVLRSHFPDEGFVQVTNKKVVELTGKSLRQAQRYLKHLENEGLLEVRVVKSRTDAGTVATTRLVRFKN